MGHPRLSPFACAVFVLALVVACSGAEDPAPPPTAPAMPAQSASPAPVAPSATRAPPTAAIATSTATRAPSPSDAEKTARVVFAPSGAVCTTATDATCVRAVYTGAPGDYSTIADIPVEALITPDAAGRYHVERGEQVTVITAATVPTGYTRFYLQWSPTGTPEPTSFTRLVPPVGTTYTFRPTPDEAGSTLITFDLTAARPRPLAIGDKPELGDMVATTVFQVETETFRYDSFDTTGEASTAGSYAFLMPDDDEDADDATTAVTTYEQLRDGTTTALIINTTDAHGAPQANHYGSVEVGDLFEWREGDDCWVRYEVTEVMPDPAGAAARKLLGVDWFGYAGTGCSGDISAQSPVEFRASPSDITLRGVAAPIRWGSWLLIPSAWTGSVEPSAAAPSGSTALQVGTPPETAYVETTDLVSAEAHLLWRGPTLPAPSGFVSAEWGSERCGGFDAGGYCSSWHSGGTHVGIYAFRHDYRPRHLEVLGTAGDWRYEARAIGGHPAVVLHNTAGSGQMRVRIWDESRLTEYETIMYVEPPATTLETVIGIALSLVETTAP